MENRITTGKEFVTALEKIGLSPIYKREIDLGRGEFSLIFAYKSTNENEAIINSIYTSNEWAEVVLVRYDGGFYIDLPKPNVIVEYFEERI